MIFAFALEPEVVASWGRSDAFRFIADKFGSGTPRVLFEFPKFTKWKRAVYGKAEAMALSQDDLVRLAELLSRLEECRCRRPALASGPGEWLENAEREHDRSDFGMIVAGANPRGHHAVLIAERLGPNEPRWACTPGGPIPRDPAALAAALSPLLANCRELHLVDPHFGPENPRHRQALEALLNEVLRRGGAPQTIRIHSTEKSNLGFFEDRAREWSKRLPAPLCLEFVRWRQRPGGERLHNRYVLSDLGGVSVPAGLDKGRQGETDDLSLLSREQWTCRWNQYALEDGTFECVDRPDPVHGQVRADRGSHRATE